MSYDLAFWKQSAEVGLSAPEVYAAICEGEFVEGLEELNRDVIVERLYELYPSMEETSLDWSGQTGAFHMEFGGQSVVVCCSSLEDGEMNRLIDLMLEFDCPLYDPQVATRFVGG